MVQAGNSSGQAARPLPAGAGYERAPLWQIASIFLLTFLAYLPALHGGLLWDDDRHVTKLALRTWGGLARIWFEVGATQQYYPVAHSAFWIEHRLWGDATLGYHLINVFLHVGNACLFMGVLRRLWAARDPQNETLTRSATSIAAWIGGLLFALHPVCVESVAWISEQKNTLSTAFYLLAGLTYLGPVGSRDSLRGSGGASGPALPFGSYAAATLLFVLALLSKSVTATLPAAILVVLWWRRGRLVWSDVVPLIPWFILGAGIGLFTSRVEQTYIIGAESSEFTLGLLARALLAGRAVWFYLGKLAWPADLTFIYPRWTIDPGVAWQYVFPLGVLVALGALWRWARTRRGPLACALFFGGSLFPALGFFNVYPFIYSYVADHFQYLASFGILALAAASLKGGRAPGWAFGLAFGLVGILGVLTWRQCGEYRDAETLYRANLARNPASWMAHTNLGKLLRESGRNEEGLIQYEQALKAKPDAKVHYDLGAALMGAGRLDEARAHYEEALRLRPAFPEAHSNLAMVLAATGHLPEAIAHDEAALRLMPDSAEVHNNLGNILVSEDRLPEAVDHFAAAIRSQPEYASPHNGLGAVYFRTGRIEEAAQEFAAAVRLKPGYAEGHLNLALALTRLGRRDEAIAHCDAALRLKPGLTRARTLRQQLTDSSQTRLPGPAAGAP